ncbi:MAG: hypothetical protein ACYTGG_07635 [Planctomycetota bacterium]|jgi:hypothetical protein
MINRSALTGPLIWSALAVATCLVMLLVGALQILGATFASGVSEEKPSEFLAGLEQDHQSSVETDRNRVDGRNLFYPTRKTPTAAAPPPPPPPPPDDDEPEIVAPPEPTAPASYQGPSIMAVVGESVWFNPVRSGEKLLIVNTGETKEGVTVLTTNPPWSARVGYQGGEYDVDLLLMTLPGLVAATDLDAEVPGLIPAASESETPPAGEAADDGTDDTDDEEGTDTPPAEAGEPAAADKTESNTEKTGLADDVLASRNGEPTDDRVRDSSTGRPRPAEARPAPTRPDAK